MYMSSPYRTIEELGVFKIHGFWGVFNLILNN